MFDLVLVGVVFAALQGGAIAGMLAGTIGGLLQDVLSGGIVGVGGLAKTLVGCVTGVVGTQFVVARPSARAVIVAVATVVHRLVMVGLQALIDQQWPGVSWGAYAGRNRRSMPRRRSSCFRRRRRCPASWRGSGSAAGRA